MSFSLSFTVDILFQATLWPQIDTFSQVLKTNQSRSAKFYADVSIFGKN